MKGLMLIFLWNLFILIGGKLLKCPEKTNQTIICTENEDYMSDRVPRPIPRKITSIIDVKDIIGINEDEKTMTVYLHLIMEWQDPQLDARGPKGKKYVIRGSIHTFTEINHYLISELVIGTKLILRLLQIFGLQTSDS